MSRNTTYAAGSEVKSADLNAMQDCTGALQTIQSVTTAIALHNLALAATTSVLRVNPTAGVSMSGMVGGVDGRRVEIWNVSATGFGLTFTDLDAGSSLGNRIILSGVGLLAPRGCALARYFSADSSWRVAVLG
jgi:hypothetical protein